MNTAFEYAYRDASNSKRYSIVVFGGPPDEALTARLTAALHDEVRLIADQVRIPELFFESTNEDDHCWHEFVEVTPTKEMANDVHGRSFAAFVEEVERANEEGWREFWAGERRR